MSKTPGNKILTEGDPKSKQFFGRHLITAALEQLYEGYTISYPDPSKRDSKLSTLATSSYSHPVILYGSNEDDRFNPGLVASKYGRVVVDTGFTKLWKEWDTAGK